MSKRIVAATLAVIMPALCTPLGAQVARPATAHRSEELSHAQRVDSAVQVPTMAHDVRVGAIIGGFSGFVLAAVVATLNHANRAGFVLCAPQPQGFGCASERKPATARLYLAIGTAGGALLGAAMGAGYHQNRAAR